METLKMQILISNFPNFPYKNVIKMSNKWTLDFFFN